MVFCVKMLEKTGMESGGHPTPVIGSQLGDENGRSPGIEIPFGPTVVAPGTMLVEPYGRCRSLGRTVPGGMKQPVSAKNAPQASAVDNAASVAAKASDMACRSRQVFGLPGLRSCEASKRCPWRPM